MCGLWFIGALSGWLLTVWSYLRRAEGRQRQRSQIHCLIGATLDASARLVVAGQSSAPLGVSLVTGALALIAWLPLIAENKTEGCLVGALLALLIAAAWIILADFLGVLRSDCLDLARKFCQRLLPQFARQQQCNRPG